MFNGVLFWLWTRYRPGHRAAAGSELGCHFGRIWVGIVLGLEFGCGNLKSNEKGTNEKALLPFGSAEQGFVRVWSVALMQTIRRYLLTSGLRSSDLGIPRCGLSVPANHEHRMPPKPTVLRAAIVWGWRYEFMEWC